MKKRILFIDDEPKVLQGLRRALRSQTDVWDMVYVADVAKATFRRNPLPPLRLQAAWATS